LGLLGVIFLSHVQRFDENRRRTDDQKLGDSELRFWRDANYMSQQHVSGRSALNYVELVKWGVKRRHPWFSLCLRPDGDYMTSTKRLTILLVLLLNMTLVCSLLVGQEQKLPFVSGDFANALVAVLFSFPVPFIFSKLFFR
jgi:hypothetical protein